MIRLVLPLGGCLLLAACSPDAVADPSDGGTTTTTATTAATTVPGTGSTGDDSPGSTGDGPGSTGAPTTGDVEEEVFEPAPGGLRRLQRHQYIGSIRYLFGHAAAAAAAPPEDYSLHGFDAIGAAELSLQESAIEQLETSARAIAVATVADRSALGGHVPCVLEGDPGDSCYDAVAVDLGRLAWRRPLTADEVDSMVAIAKQARTWGGNFATGLQYELMALLQSPYFIYLVEVGEPDPDDPAVRRLTSTELAARMSFFLLGRTPDAELLAAAEAGELVTDDDVRALAEAMLARPEARATLSTFYSELFQLRDLSTLNKSNELFPQFTPELAYAMKYETLRLIEDIVWEQDGDFRTLIDADYTYVNPALAALYGLPSPPGQGFAKVDLAAEHGRAGLLGQASFLARFAHPAETSPTRRGLFIRTKLLCEKVPPPPPGVDASLPTEDPDEPQTMKQKLVQHMEDPSCSGCHVQLDPLGFALENYDPIGAFRTLDDGLAIDPSASIPDLGEVASARELADLLAADPRVTACVIKNFVRGSLGHLERLGEIDVLDDLEADFVANDHRLQHLLVELTTSPVFRAVGAPK
jgi:PAS domain-containing protein